MKKVKQRFKDTNLGKRIINAIPEAADFVGDLLPDQGVFGVAKRLIDKATISPQEKKALQMEIMRAESQYLADVQNARDNEAKKDMSEHSSWLSKNIHELIALMVILPWVTLLVYTFVMEITNPGHLNLDNIKMLFAIFGITNVVSLIFGFLYGRSKPQD